MQWEEPDSLGGTDFITWCADKINETDISYVRERQRGSEGTQSLTDKSIQDLIAASRYEILKKLVGDNYAILYKIVDMTRTKAWQDSSRSENALTLYLELQNLVLPENTDEQRTAS